MDIVMSSFYVCFHSIDLYTLQIRSGIQFDRLHLFVRRFVLVREDIIINRVCLFIGTLFFIIIA